MVKLDITHAYQTVVNLGEEGTKHVVFEPGKDYTKKEAEIAEKYCGLKVKEEVAKTSTTSNTVSGDQNKK